MSKIFRQKFACHRLLLSVVSTYFQERLHNWQDQWLFFDDTSPEAFQKVIDFIYHKKPFKIGKSGVPGSSFQFIKMTLEVLGLANKFRLAKLVNHCEEVVAMKIRLTRDNCQQVCFAFAFLLIVHIMF